MDEWSELVGEGGKPEEWGENGGSLFRLMVSYCVSKKVKERHKNFHNLKVTSWECTK